MMCCPIKLWCISFIYVGIYLCLYIRFSQILDFYEFCDRWLWLRFMPGAARLILLTSWRDLLSYALYSLKVLHRTLMAAFMCLRYAWIDFHELSSSQKIFFSAEKLDGSFTHFIILSCIGCQWHRGFRFTNRKGYFKLGPTGLFWKSSFFRFFQGDLFAYNNLLPSYQYQVGMNFVTARSESSILHVFPFNSEKKRGGVAIQTVLSYWHFNSIM